MASRAGKVSGNIKGKTLFISGGSRGIGLAIALRAARDGANVIIAAKTAEPHPKLPGTIYTAAEEIEQAGGKALAVVCDIRSEEAVENAVQQGVARFGGIDICINNASAISLEPTLATSMRRFDLMHQVNTRGTFLVSKTCIPHLKKAPNPHILNLSPPLEMKARWHRGECTVAAHGHRDSGCAEPAWRRPDRSPFSQARDNGGCGPHYSVQEQPRVQRQFLCR
jgi:citronellol/citronellal dehydrogenase